MIRFSLFLVLFIFFGVSYKATGQDQGETADITDISTFFSKRKGFNLLGKFDVSWSNNGYKETEFKLIHDLGFNFVRLPLDFRTYTQFGNWDKFIETELVKIDKAVEWGIKYNVHVCINLHRAPGYCVNSTTLPASQQLNLWTDTTAQVAFVNHWKVFANRYKVFKLHVPGQKSETSEKVKASLETGELLDACPQLLQYFENSQILL